jgi:CubicO group peptidase (beta-lactamase class C family)
VDTLAGAEGFSGVVRVDRDGDIELARAYGLAHRGFEIANKVDTQFALASGTKGLTALTVVRLIEEGSLAFSTTARSVLGQDLPLIGDDVTIEHLLSHRSGIGGYFEEEEDLDVTDYLLPVPVHSLRRPSSTSLCSVATPPSSHPASGSHTATAATWCSR